jgi:hypothetical protein
MRIGLGLVAASVVVMGCSQIFGSGEDEVNGLDAGNGNGNGNGDAGTEPIEPGASLTERLTTTAVTVPSGVKAGVTSWRIWGRASLGISPVFTVPLANCETLVGFTGQDGVARAVRLDAGEELVAIHELGTDRELRGLAAEPSGHFGALLWDNAGDRIFVHRFDAAGELDWSQELVNEVAVPDDFGIGDSRFEFGNGRYGAYYHVHGIDGPFSGHEGDTLRWVSQGGEPLPGGWDWGCSHSMSALLRYHDTGETFMPACVTDCFPGSSGVQNPIGGIYLNHNARKVMDVFAGCNGNVAAELGGAAVAPSGWKLVFNAHQAEANAGVAYDPATMNQDIGFVSVANDLAPDAVVWLTDTEAINETDPTIARWTPADDTAEQYIVGWAEPGSSYRYKLARVDATGSFLEGPTDVSASVAWGRRDDPMRRHHNGDVVWAWFDSAGSTTLNLARIDAGQNHTCASFE